MSRQDFNELVSDTLNSADFRRALLAVSDKTATRPVRSGRCVVVEVPETARRDEFSDIAPGTVTAFVALEGEELLGTLVQTIRAKDSKKFTATTDQIKRIGSTALGGHGSPGKHSDPESREMPAFAMIGYAGKVLISHLYVDEVLRVNVHPFVFNGGALDADKFSITEYYEPGNDTPLTCVMVVRHPQLSNIEKEALRLVPSGSPNSVAISVVAPLTPALLQVVLIATPYAAQWLKNEIVNWLFGTVAINPIPDQVLESVGLKEMLKSLPPKASAAELLRLRTDILLRGAPK